MKKIIVLLLAGLLLFASACGRQENTPATGQKETNSGTEAYDPSKTVEFEMKTSESNRIVTVGTVDKSLYNSPILITSFGQSTDAATLDTAMKRAGANYDYKPQATADEIGSYKTLVIAVGASTKGLGQAGISEKDETARAEAIMAKAKETGAQVVCVHIGGETRRGVLSDALADLVLPQSSLIILKEDANWDGKFTNYAEQNKLPIILIFGQKDTVQVMTDVFGK